MVVSPNAWSMTADSGDRAFDWNGHYVESSSALAGTLEDAFNETGPSLVVIPIDYRENPLLTKKLGVITCTI